MIKRMVLDIKSPCKCVFLKTPEKICMYKWLLSDENGDEDFGCNYYYDKERNEWIFDTKCPLKDVTDEQ